MHQHRLPPDDRSVTRGELRDAVGDVKDDLKTHYLSKSEFYKYVAGVVIVVLIAVVSWWVARA